MKVSQFGAAVRQFTLAPMLLVAPVAILIFGCTSPSPSYEGGRRNILNGVPWGQRLNLYIGDWIHSPIGQLIPVPE